MKNPNIAMIPSGYVGSKLFSILPTDGSGDFTYARDSNASRVNKSGIIEIVADDVPRLDWRTPDKLYFKNHITRSDLVDSIESHNYSELVTEINPFNFGGSWLVETGTNNLYQSAYLKEGSTTTNCTYSIYAKKGSTNFISLTLNNGAASKITVFNFNTKTFSNESGYSFSNSFEELSNGWFRLSITLTITGKVFYANIQSSDKLNTSDYGTLYLYAPQLNLGNSAQEYVENNTYKSFKDVISLSNSRLLIEKEAINLFRDSEDIASMTATNTIKELNKTVSPDGKIRGDKVSRASTTPNNLETNFLTKNFTKTATDNFYVYSVFVKNIDSNYLSISLNGTALYNFNLLGNLLVGGISNADFQEFLPSIEYYGNDWYRISLYFKASSTVTSFNIGLSPRKQPWNLTETSDNCSIYVWGQQLEEVNESNTTPTSYIQTGSVVIRREMDTYDNTNGVSNLNYPFTVYSEVEFNNDVGGYGFSLLDKTTSTNYYSMHFNNTSVNKITMVASPNGTSNLLTSSSTFNSGFHKIACVFESETDMLLYIDGNLEGVKNDCVSNTINSSINDILLGQLRTISDTLDRTNIKDFRIYNHQLNNVELINITK